MLLLALLLALFGVASANAQSVPPVDCKCVANLPQMRTNGCSGVIPDLCAIATNCFSSNVVVNAAGQPSCYQSPAAGTVVGPGTTQISLTVMDINGVAVTCIVPFTVIPPSGGNLSLICASNKNVQCGFAWNFDPPVPSGACCTSSAGTPGGVTVTVLSTMTNGVCPQTIAQAWQATDVCGNTATCTQTVTVVDTTPPAVLCTNSPGPNIVANPGFETNTACPSTTSQLNLAGPWFPATAGTPDYFHACVGSFVSTPNNFKGNQIPHGGQAYAGGYVYSQFGSQPMNCYREYLETPLTTPLVANQVYRVSFWVCLAEDSSWAIGNLGAYLSVGPLTDYTSSGVLAATPQVANPPSNLLTSSNTWTQISGFYIAAGGEDHLTIGNFDVDTSTMATPTPTSVDAYSYYYYDDVTVRPACVGGTTKTVICGSQWTFDPPLGYDACSGSNVTVNVVGTVTNGSCPTSITRTWSLTDFCGNTTNWSQTVLVVDTTPPVITCASNKTVNCGTTWTFDPPTAFDACSGTNVTIIALNTVTNGTNPQQITQIWSAVDPCGNSNQCSQTVTILGGHCCCDFINGTFDQPVPTNGTGGGWTSSNLYSGNGWQPTGGNPGGTFLLNNVGDPNTDPTISQTLCCLAPGQCYKIYGDRKVQAWFGNTSNSFAVLVNGTPILLLPVPTNPADTNWHPFTATFTATNTCETISFAAEYGGTDVSYWVDNLHIECCTNDCTVTHTVATIFSGADTNDVLLPGGSLDPQFATGAAPFTTPNPYVMTNIHSLWLTNGPTSQWVGPDPGLVNSPNGVYAYTNTFYLPCTNLAAATGRWAGDDSGTIYLNGQPTGVTLPNGWAFTNWSPVNITSGFVPGWNTMVFYITNSGASPTGLRTEVTIAGVDAACCNNCLSITCPPDVIAHICANQGPVTYPAPLVVDSCGGTATVTCAPPSGGSFPLGTNTVVCTATDNQGNSAWCSFHVIVLPDNTPPSVKCPPLITNVPGCHPVMPNFTNGLVAGDNCTPPAQLIITQTPPPGTPLTATQTVVIINVCDQAGNCRPCDVIVNAPGLDNTPPVVHCPGDIVVFTCGSNAVVKWRSYATDNLTPFVTASCSPPPGSTFPIGTNLVICTAVDACGNIGSCSFHVIVKPYFTPSSPPTTIITAGVPDNFAFPTDPVVLSPCVVSKFPSGTLFKAFDDPNYNKLFAHRINSLPNNIVRAEMVIRMEPCTFDSPNNDRIYLGCTGTGFAWSAPVYFLPGAGGTWNIGHPATTFTLDLGNLPGGGNLIPKLNTDQFLDVVVHDDTIVDYIQLRLWVCPPPSGTGLPHNNNWTNASKLSIVGGLELPQFGPIGADSAMFALEPPDGATTGAVEIQTGEALSFALTTILDMSAPVGATIQFDDPSDPNTNGPLCTFARDNRGWNLKVAKRCFADDSDNYRCAAVNTNSELLDSFAQTYFDSATNPPLALIADSSTPQFPVTLRFDWELGTVTVSFPGSVDYRYCRTCISHGWDGTIKGRLVPKGWDGTIKGRVDDASVITFTPTGSPQPPPRPSVLITTVGLSECLFGAESIGTLSQRSGTTGRADFNNLSICLPMKRSSALIASLPGGIGVTLNALSDGDGLSIDLGNTASLRAGIHHFETGDIPTEEQIFRLVGPPKLINRPPPPTNFLRLAHSPYGVDCSADFSDLGAMSVSAQFLSNGVVIAQASGLSAFLASPICSLDQWPDHFAWSSTDGSLTLTSLSGFVLQPGSNPAGGLMCPGCVGDTLRIVPLLPEGAAPPVSASELQVVTSGGMTTTLYDLQATSACPPATFNLTPSSTGGVLVDWSASGYRLQGAETAAGPWYELGSTSPVDIPASAGLRLFRLVCQ